MNPCYLLEKIVTTIVSNSSQKYYRASSKMIKLSYEVSELGKMACGVYPSSWNNKNLILPLHLLQI